MASPVNINLYSDPGYSAPIIGAAVGVYDSTTLAELAYGVTDSNGLMACMLEMGTYEIRCSKLGVRFLSPAARIQVLAGPNYFVGLGLLLDIPASVDPRCCTVTGRFMGINNQPIVGATVRYVSKAAIDSTQQSLPGIQDESSNTRIPISVDGNGIVASKWATKTDSSGFASVDLIRGAQLYVTFSGEDDQLWEIKIPNRASANLFDLINPFPTTLAWNQTDVPGNTLTLVAGGEGADVHYELNFSDFIERDSGLSSWIEVRSDNDSIVLVDDLDGHVIVAGIAPGTAHIIATLKDVLHPARVPEPTIIYTPIVVTVTP